MINSLVQQGISTYTGITRKNQQAASLLQPTKENFSGLAKSSSTTVSISPNAYVALKNNAMKVSHESGQGPIPDMSSIVDRIKDDPSFADEMAYIYSFSPDGELIDLEKDLPPLDGSKGTGTYKTIDEYFKHSTEFDVAAQEVMRQRQQIYMSMKAQGASGLDIFSSLMEFNKTLPTDYQQTTGLDKLAASFYSK